MKKQILISLILLNSVFVVNAQWTGSSIDGDIWRNGNIKIGVNQVNSYLMINTSSRSWWTGVGINSGDNRFVIYDATASLHRLTIGTDGNVGIGTGTDFPAYKLDVNGTGRFGAYALIGTGISAGYYQDASNGAYRSLNVGGNTGYYFQNYNGISTTMFVGLQGMYAGNVGIGTISPLNGLHVYKNNDLNGGSIRFGYSGANDAVISFGWNPSISNDAFKLSYFPHNSTSNAVDLFTVGVNGNFGIGTNSPLYKLDVNGTIHAREVKIDLNFAQADYVFKPEYKLRTLAEVEQFVKTNSHLPEIPSAAETKENGINIGEMQNKLLQKIEEMTLYLIEQKNEIQVLKNEIEELKKK